MQNIAVAAIEALQSDLIDRNKLQAWLLRQMHDAPVCPSCKTEATGHAAVSFWHGGRVCCRNCKAYYSATSKTPLSGLKTPPQRLFLAILGHGLGLGTSKISDLAGIDPSTVREIKGRFAAAGHDLSSLRGKIERQQSAAGV